jgi:hypothetical protein
MSSFLFHLLFSKVHHCTAIFVLFSEHTERQSEKRHLEFEKDLFTTNMNVSFSIVADTSAPVTDNSYKDLNRSSDHVDLDVDAHVNHDDNVAEISGGKYEDLNSLSECLNVVETSPPDDSAENNLVNCSPEKSKKSDDVDGNVLEISSDGNGKNMASDQNEIVKSESLNLDDSGLGNSQNICEASATECVDTSSRDVGGSEPECVTNSVVGLESSVGQNQKRGRPRKGSTAKTSIVSPRRSNRVTAMPDRLEPSPHSYPKRKRISLDLPKAEDKCSDSAVNSGAESSKTSVKKTRTRSTSSKTLAKNEAMTCTKSNETNRRGRKRAQTFPMKQNLQSSVNETDSKEKTKKRKIQVQLEQNNDTPPLSQDAALPTPSKSLDDLIESLKTPSKVLKHRTMHKTIVSPPVRCSKRKSMELPVAKVAESLVSSGEEAELGQSKDLRDHSPELGLGPSRPARSRDNSPHLVTESAINHPLQTLSSNPSLSSENSCADKVVEKPTKLPRSRAAKKPRKPAAKKAQNEKGNKKTMSSVYNGLLEDLETADCLGTAVQTSEDHLVAERNIAEVEEGGPVRKRYVCLPRVTINYFPNF